jgi:hypothetical protein
MLALNLFGAGQIGDGARHLLDAVVSPRAEIEFGNRHFEKRLRVFFQPAGFAHIF